MSIITKKLCTQQTHQIQYDVPLLNLPKDIFLEIFSRLDAKAIIQATRSCKQLRASPIIKEALLKSSYGTVDGKILMQYKYALALYSQEFPKFNFTKFKTDERCNDGNIDFITQCCPLLEEITLTNINSVFQHVIHVIARNCPYIKSINIQHSSYTFYSNVPFENFKNLESLIIKHSRVPAHHLYSNDPLVSEDDLIYLGNHCPNLKIFKYKVRDPLRTKEAQEAIEKLKEKGILVKTDY